MVLTRSLASALLAVGALAAAPVASAEPDDPDPAPVTEEELSQGVLAFTDILAPNVGIVPAEPVAPEPVIGPVEVGEVAPEAVPAPAPAVVSAEEPEPDDGLRADGSDPGIPGPGGSFIRPSLFFAPTTLAR